MIGKALVEGDAEVISTNPAAGHWFLLFLGARYLVSVICNERNPSASMSSYVDAPEVSGSV